MSPLLLLNSQILLLFGEDFSAASVPHKKVTMKPWVNLHMHNIMQMVTLNCVLQARVLVTEFIRKRSPLWK